jgi:MerR family mercuric resistance operon transcriptional regulator
VKENSVPKRLTSGGIAKSAGVNVETLRYYERRGLLPKPTRSSSGYRHYSPDTVRQLRFIKKAQSLGFTLEEIRELLHLRIGRGASQCADIRRRASAKVDEVEAKLKSLRRMKRALDRLVVSCDSKGPAAACPILDALEESEEE